MKSAIHCVLWLPERTVQLFYKSLLIERACSTQVRTTGRQELQSEKKYKAYDIERTYFKTLSHSSYPLLVNE